MTTTTHVRLADPLGQHMATIAQYPRLHYVMRSDPGGIGVCELTVPPGFDLNLFKIDGRIGVWRSINGRPPALDNGAIYLIRKLQINPDETATATAYHATSLLGRRIIAYYAGSAFADKSAAAADDMIKAIVAENMGSSIDAARLGSTTQDDVSAYLTIQADASLGAVVDKAFAWRNVYEVAVELCEASTVAGTYLTFEVIAPTESTLELRTYTDQRGVDRRASSGQAVILSTARGNLENVTVIEDHSEEATWTLAGGQGERETRLVQSGASTARMAVSPFGRVERFVDMSNVETTAALADEAAAALWYARPVITFSGDLVETPATTRGIQFDLGDLVTAEAAGRQYDCRIDLVDVTIAGGRRVEQVALRSST